MLHLNKMINLDTGALQTETTGEKIVCKLQEYLLSKMSPDERAVLPEDKIQHLFVGVCDLLYSIFQQYAQESTTISIFYSHSLSCDSLQACNQLELATHIEMTASLLHQDAIVVIKTALAGTQTDRLVNILEAGFVGEEKLSLLSSNPLGEEEEEEDKVLEALLSEHSKLRELPPAPYLKLSSENCLLLLKKKQSGLPLIPARVGSLPSRKLHHSSPPPPIKPNTFTLELTPSSFPPMSLAPPPPKLAIIANFLLSLRRKASWCLSVSFSQLQKLS